MPGGCGGSKNPLLMPESNEKTYKVFKNLIGLEANAFDTVAHEYDAAFSHTAVGRLLRERVWAIGSTAFRPSGEGAFTPLNDIFSAVNGTVPDGINAVLPQALELNCGTGEDAIWLARQGWRVLATDISAKMVALAKAKIEQAGLAEKASAKVCSFAEVGQLPERNFDLIFSNFGGLNCVSPEELEKLGAVFFQKLKPGGKFVAVVMGRFCWWESLYFLLKMKPREAFRRFGKRPLEARLDAQTTVPTWYYSPSEFQNLLQFNSQRSKVRPIGFWLPPSYLNPFFEKRPRLLGFLNFLEKNCTPSWLTFAADHFLICLENNLQTSKPPTPPPTKPSCPPRLGRRGRAGRLRFTCGNPSATEGG